MTEPYIENDLERWERTSNILAEVLGEYESQVDQWGQQDYPLVAPEDPTGIYLLGRTYRSLEIKAKELGKHCGPNDSWARIELEEIFEALSQRSPSKARAEWLQVAAVAVHVIAAIDRAAGFPPEGPPLVPAPSRYTDVFLPGDGSVVVGGDDA